MVVQVVVVVMMVVQVARGGRVGWRSAVTAVATAVGEAAVIVTARRRVRTFGLLQQTKGERSVTQSVRCSRSSSKSQHVVSTGGNTHTIDTVLYCR